jgi:hypothetical protein
MERLPLELLIHVSIFLDPRSFLNLSRTSRQFYGALQDETTSRRFLKVNSESWYAR